MTAVMTMATGESELYSRPVFWENDKMLVYARFLQLISDSNPDHIQVHLFTLTG